MMWGAVERSSGLVMISMNPSSPAISARPSSALNLVPTGFCIQEFAARMKVDESSVPMAAA